MKVKGLVPSFFYGYDSSKISDESIIGRPINNNSGKKIGVIESIKDGVWYGEITDKQAEEEIKSYNEVSSFEIKSNE